MGEAAGAAEEGRMEGMAMVEVESEALVVVETTAVGGFVVAVAEMVGGKEEAAKLTHRKLVARSLPVQLALRPSLRNRCTERLEQ